MVLIVIQNMCNVASYLKFLWVFPPLELKKSSWFTTDILCMDLLQLRTNNNSQIECLLIFKWWQWISSSAGVTLERLTEGLSPRHCALSLVGEPIMYPEINILVDELHRRRISTFLVTNAQFPEKIKMLKPITQVQMILLLFFISYVNYPYVLIFEFQTLGGPCSYM